MPGRKHAKSSTSGASSPRSTDDQTSYGRCVFTSFCAFPPPGRLTVMSVRTIGAAPHTRHTMRARSAERVTPPEAHGVLHAFTNW